MTIERIVWVDHHHAHSDDWWSSPEIIERAGQPWTVKTVGLFVYEDRDTVVLAGEWNQNADGSSQYRGWTAIMKALIVSRTVLTEPTTAPKPVSS